jgi:PAS domain S-box-containing protein
MNAVNNNAVVMADADGVIRFWNDGAQAAFGHNAAEALGQTLDLIVPQQFREAHWAGYRRALATGSAAAEGDPGPFPALIGGEIVPTLGRLTLIRDPRHKVVGAVVVFG